MSPGSAEPGPHGAREPALRVPTAVVAAGAVGFGVMAAELTAVRLLAPHFGDSAYVWTNVIGVILAAMAIGATLGGRLSGRDDAARWPFRMLLLGGVLLLAAPFLVRGLGAALLPADLPLDAAMPALIRGSFVTTAVVFAPPLLLLSAVTPLLIVLLARSGTPLGRAAGDVAAAGTVGSLAGTFAATHWLVPTFGCRLSLVLAAAVLLAAGVLVAPLRRRALCAATLCLAGLSTLLHGGPLRAAPAGATLLAERETPYQFLQVVRHAADGEPARTSLLINEGLDSFHSLAVEGSAFTGGAYYDWHAIAPLLAGDGARPPGAKALSIGDAAGTLRRVYAAVHPGMPVDAVDIDAETMALGDEFFPGPKATGERFALDGRLMLSLGAERYHVVHVDAYAHQVYVPAHLASREFFAAAHERLEPGGVVACNVGALTVDDAVLRAIAATMRDVFGHAFVMLLPQSRNALLIGRKGGPPHPESLAGAPEVEGLGAADRAHWRAILDAASDASRWQDLDGSGPVLTDDLPVLDELLLDSYVDRDDPGEPVATAGTRGAVDVELAVQAAARAKRWQDVLQAVAEAREPTAYLRLLAGDARWQMRQLASAVAEYEAGASLEADAALRETLVQRLAGAREELAPIAAADRAARRSGWLGGLVVAAGLGIALAVRRV